MVVGRLLTGRAAAKADESDVVAFFSRYAGWRGVAGWRLLRSARVARGRRLP